MIDKLSFEIDEEIYDRLQADLAVKKPVFTGKLSPKLPRLINQWVSEDEGRGKRPDKSGTTGRTIHTTSLRFSPDDKTSAKILQTADLSETGSVLETTTARAPRLVNPWISGKGPAQAFENRRDNVRKHDRIPCTMLVEYEVSSQVYIDFVRNVSRSGAYLETRKEMAIGEQVILMIPLSRDQRMIRVKGVIVRKEPAGVGIMFQKLLTPS